MAFVQRMVKDEAFRKRVFAQQEKDAACEAWRNGYGSKDPNDLMLDEAAPTADKDVLSAAEAASLESAANRAAEVRVVAQSLAFVQGQERFEEFRV